VAEFWNPTGRINRPNSDYYDGPARAGSTRAGHSLQETTQQAGVGCLLGSGRQCVMLAVFRRPAQAVTRLPPSPSNEYRSGAHRKDGALATGTSQQRRGGMLACASLGTP